MLGGALAFAAIAGALALLRPRPEPYVPGREVERGTEITRSLDRERPGEADPGGPRSGGTAPAIAGSRVRTERPGDVVFEDAAEAAGLLFTHFHGRRSTQLPEDMGSGLAWGDYDGDGDPDLFVVNQSGPLALSPEEVAASPAHARLFRNDAGRFADVTLEAGLAVRGTGMGAAWGDYDGDGRLDLFVTRYGTNLLFRNEGGGRFRDVSKPSGVGADEGFWAGVAWADFDRDGDLDAYVCGYVRYDYDPARARETSRHFKAIVPFTLNPSSYPPVPNLLLRNDGGRFRDVAREAGVDNPAGRSLNAAWADFDGDGWPDLYVANDVSDNAMFLNLGDGGFRDISHSAWVADYRGAMGLGIGDWDGDLDLDVFVTHWLAQENALYADESRSMKVTAEAPLRYVDQADLFGLGQIALDVIGWGAGFFDYDNDGRLDVFAINGSTFQEEEDPALLVPMRSFLFSNAGDHGYFEVGAKAGEPFVSPLVGRGASFADFDGDGDLDLAVVVHGGRLRLARNHGGNARGWLRLVLRGAAGRGKGPRSTTFATGARVVLTTAAGSQVREVGGQPSYLSQEPPGEVFFGTGDASVVDRLEIRWPSGRVQALERLPVRATVEVVEGGAPRALGGEDRREAVKAFWAKLHAANEARLRSGCAVAVALYEEALALDPRHEDALYYLGQCRREAGRPAGARAAFERLVDVNPSSARGHLSLGALLASPDPAEPMDLAAAEVHLRRAHAINGEETGPVVRLGEVLLVSGRAAEAREWFEAALRTNPKSLEAAFLAGFVAWEQGSAEAARLARRVHAAAALDAPVKGVLSEGDRKDARRAVAPPLESPLGRLLFGAPIARLRGRAHAGERLEYTLITSSWHEARSLRAGFVARSGRAENRRVIR
jgi:tetratricopeptide (TPR) repeat protein